jgi:hypothetical protein
MAAALLTISLIILEYYPERHTIIAPSFLTLGFLTVGNMYAASDAYVLHEYTLPVMSACFLVCSLVPHHIYSICLVWVFGITYQAYQISYKQNMIPVSYWIAILPSMFYYAATSYIFNAKLKDLYEYLRNNEILRMQMKKVLEVFPNAVMIQSALNTGVNQNNLTFKNHQFEGQIMNIKKRTRELDNIDVSFEQTISSGNIQSVTCDLNTYLEEVHKRLKDNEVFEQKKVTMKFKRQFDDTIHDTSGSDDQNKEDKYFNIKTMNVEWEGQKCYMDVFIDNTDILKLEEANNNIKCQKIMFASASHEFRTPLNAIMNSFRFVDDCYAQIEACIDKVDYVNN